MRSDFACFILCHGRPNNTPTFSTLRKYGYTGAIYIICDDEDKTLQEYRNIYGDDIVKVFNKLDVLQKFDTMDSSDNRGCAVYARNACFDIADELGIRYFCELDDDYMEFQLRYPSDNKLKLVYPRSLDDVFDAYLDFYIESDITALAMAQGGDFIGGLNGNGYKKRVHRKCMNSWFCDVQKRFYFNGRMNDDVNTYALLGSRGDVFLTLVDCMINQPDTQTVKGGMTDMYSGEGTYVKSFYTVMCCPSFAKVNIMGDGHYRIHHNINQNNAYPKIISSKYRKEK